MKPRNCGSGDETIEFRQHLPIKLLYENAECYYKCNKYNSDVMNIGYTWHQIVVEHKNSILGMERKQLILDAIFEAINGEEFYPVAYRRYDGFDMFLVRQCKAALDELFKKNLSIILANKLTLRLEIQFNIAVYKVGQLSPHTIIATVLNGLYNCMETYKNQRGILNLSNFANNREFNEITVNLGNLGVFERVCDFIYKNDGKFRTINGLMLNDNNIHSLAPLKIFNDVPLAVLDLRNNNLKSIEQVCKELSHIKTDDLLLLGNPLTSSPKYPHGFKVLSKNFKFLDNMTIENLNYNSEVCNDNVVITNDGYRIDWTNKKDIEKFRDSNQWHAIVIPDSEYTYDRTTIIGFFFLSFPVELTEFYPCYYKYSDGEHKFVLKDTFDQLLYFTNEKHLQIDIPDFSAPNATNRGSRTINSYLQMNTMPYRKGQVEFTNALEKALKNRFRVMDRVLNLNNFQSAEGLENIIVNMSSMRILSRVLTIAARKFLSNCVEIRLTNNQIVSTKLAKVLTLMENLKAIDLGNNWIPDLEAIEELGNLNLRSLRLDGNPLCSKYNTSVDYIKAVKEAFPSLTILDKSEISRGYLYTQKNYICHVERYDFVSQFVPLYFNLFELSGRATLMEMYDPFAILSFSCSVDSTASPSFARIYDQYNTYATNFLRRTSSNVGYYVGHTQITNFFHYLPEIKHDMLSFTTDFISLNTSLYILMVTGVFKDIGDKMKDDPVLASFCRTFYLKPVQSGLGPLQCGKMFKIVNEFFNICNPGPIQQKLAFQCSINDVSDSPDRTAYDEEAMIAMLQQLTSLKTVWCARCLEDADWNFERSLEVFENLCKERKIPETGFK